MPHNFTVPTNRRPVSPGELLHEEFIVPLGLTQQEFADALGIDRPALNMIVNGKRRITPEMAIRLSIVLGTTPEFWLNAQMINDLYEARHSEHAAALKKRLKPLRRRQLTHA
jgi:addiction module HigA family antidote